MLQDLHSIQYKNPVVELSELSDFRIPLNAQQQLNKILGEDGYTFDTYTSHIITAKATSTKPANIAVIPNQYMVFACDIYEFATALYPYFEIFEALRSNALQFLGNASTIKSNIQADENFKKYFGDPREIDLFAKFLDKDDNVYRFGSKRLINDSGEPRGARDCFGSVILKIINIPDTSSSVFGHFIYDLCKNQSSYDLLLDIKKSADANINSSKRLSNSALIFDNDVIRYFAKDVITYFHKNHNSQFLTLAQRNQTNTSKITLGDLTNVIKEADQELTVDELSSGEASTQRFFQEYLSEDGKYWYISTQWTGEGGERGLCFNNLKQFIEQNFKDYILKSESGKYLLLKVNSLNSLAKPFILLAGISGTGKSRFVRKQAENWQNTENFELVSVRPDWHEPSDLLGYVLRLKDKPEFISTPVIKFLVKAWLEAYKQGIVLEKDENNKLIADCTNKQTAPFWLCLDEMNLAPVEQYFSDYLSVLETREWDGEIYSCDPLIKSEFLKEVINENESQVRKAMGLKDESQDNNHDELWKFIKQNGLTIPFNLIVAGTVNMDETTHGFSRKVIDRALSWDFGEFFPNDFDLFFNPDLEPKTLSYPTLSHSSAENVGKYANETIEFLQAINKVLKGTLFELAYRALNECLLAVACEQPKDEQHLQAVWDDFLMMKVLPRIEGDEDKLQSPNTDDDNLFIALENLLETQFDKIWEGENRPDLLRENIDGSEKILIECRSKTKIQRMSKLLENGFTSFWP